MIRLARRAAIGLIGAGPALLGRAVSARPPGGADCFPVHPVLNGLDAPEGLADGRPRFGWRVAAYDDDARAIVQTGCQVVVGTAASDVAQGRGDVWQSGWIESGVTARTPTLPLPIEGHRRYWWSVRLRDRRGRTTIWSRPATFVTGVLGQVRWPAGWIAARGDSVLPPHITGQATPAMVPARPLPVMRRVFALDRPPRRAIVSVCGLGQHRLFLNGERVGCAALTPGWTNYRRSILYDTHDVTDMLRGGDNVLALMLGNGMYNVEHRAGRYTKFLDSFGQPKAILVLTIEHQDGTRSTVTSDAAWRWIDGPVRFSSIFGGEDQDAMALSPDWMRADFDDSRWPGVTIVGGPGGVLRPAATPPVVEAATRRPVSVREVGQDTLLVDFGANFAGRPRIRLASTAGPALTVVPGEALDAAGRVSQRSFNAGPGNAVEFRYVPGAGGVETFEPLFTYHGFRWLELRGVPRSAIRSIEGAELRTDAAAVGSFTCGMPLLGDIHRLIGRAVASNLVSVLTDCPHREKLGWLEQTYLNAPAVLYNRDAAPLYDKLVRDIAEAQQPDGMVPAIAPEYVAFKDAAGADQIWRNSPEWGAAAVLAPWAAYRFHGDAAILRAAWPAARAFCAYLTRRSVGGIVDFGMGDWYDVGPGEPGPAQLTSRALVGTAIRIECLYAMARIAPLVGEAAAGADYREQARRLRGKFNARFLDPVSGRYERASQTAQAMPLALGIVPAALRHRALAQLLAAIAASGNGVTAGDIGFRYVLDALAAAGRDDVVLAMLTVRDRPGYAMQLARGATALTEAWDANPTKSLNHFMLGQAEDWFYRRVGGLDIDHARSGDAALRLAPQPLAAIGEASASHILREGLLACHWRRRGDALSIEVEVPHGRRAIVDIPTPDPDSLSATADVRFMHESEPGRVRFAVGSGSHRWTARAPI